MIMNDGHSIPSADRQLLLKALGKRKHMSLETLRAKIKQVSDVAGARAN